MVTGPCLCFSYAYAFTYIWYCIYWELGLIDSPLRCEFCIFVKSATFDRCLDVSRGLPVVENQDLVSAKHRVCEQNVMKQFHILKISYFSLFLYPHAARWCLSPLVFLKFFRDMMRYFQALLFACGSPFVHNAHFGHILWSFCYRGIKLWPFYQRYQKWKFENC